MGNLIMKYLLLVVAFLFSTLVSASVAFNVNVGQDFNSPFKGTYDSVYFQSTGDTVVVEKVVVRSKTGTCELFVDMDAPMRFKWGRRWSMPMWQCKREDVESVSIYTETHIYTYGI
jgi:hypothetical protein